ncbi:MAG: hypothetical protein AAFN07_12675 [Pseudomonadota bacterium]
MQHLLNTRIYARLVSSLVLSLLVAGCAVQYVSRYDAVTETSITEIQRGVEGLLQQIERGAGTPAADYENFVATYESLHVDAAMLNSRAQALALNSITAEQSELLQEWLRSLEALHQTGIADPLLLVPVRQQAEQLFVAMLKFELAKKRQFDQGVTLQE